jgi:Lon protease-like protein
MNETSELPLFPLPFVLFPSMMIQLHIFEDRYKEMIGECLKTRGEFGVLFYNDKNNQLSNVGCSASIVQLLNLYDDGRMDILIEGQRRFQALEFIQRRSFLEASVEFFDDDTEEDVPDDVLSQVLNTYQEMIRLQTKGVGAIKGIFDPVQFSFIISSTIEIEWSEKQTLLELTSTTERIVKLKTALDDSVNRLKELRDMERHAGRNGHSKPDK